MGLSREEIDALLKAVSQTRSDEATCGECLQDLAEFAERALQGKSVPQSLQAIEQHLAACGECQKEYEALLSALKDAQ